MTVRETKGEKSEERNRVRSGPGWQVTRQGRAYKVESTCNSAGKQRSRATHTSNIFSNIVAAVAEDGRSRIYMDG